jgi:hypothetical protein
MLPSLRKFDLSEVAQERLKIIKFYKQYGETASIQAFGADRKVFNRWRQRFTQSQRRISALVPKSTKPYHTRIPMTDLRIVDWIRQEREAHPRIGKEKLKPDLDKYCRRLEIPTVSTSTIGNIIKRNSFFYQKLSYKLYHNPKFSLGMKDSQEKETLEN